MSRLEGHSVARAAWAIHPDRVFIKDALACVRPGDVLLLTVHADRDAVIALIEERSHQA